MMRIGLGEFPAEIVGLVNDRPETGHLAARYGIRGGTSRRPTILAATTTRSPNGSTEGPVPEPDGMPTAR